MTSAESKRRLVDVDETAVVADYEAYVTTGISATYIRYPSPGCTASSTPTRYLAADERSEAPQELRERILSDYTAVTTSLRLPAGEGLQRPRCPTWPSATA